MGEYISPITSETNSQKETAARLPRGGANVWEGLSLEGLSLETYIINAAGQIDVLWKRELEGHATKHLLNEESYRRVVEQIPDFSHNVKDESLRWARSKDPYRHDIGRLIISHCILKSVVSALDRVQIKYAKFDFNIDYTQLITEGLSAGLAKLFEQPESTEPKRIGWSSSHVIPRVHQAVEYAGKTEVSRLLGISVSWLDQGVNYQVAEYVNRFLKEYGRYPNAAEARKEFHYCPESDLKRFLSRVPVNPDVPVEVSINLLKDQGIHAVCQRGCVEDVFEEVERDCLKADLSWVMGSIFPSERVFLALRFGLSVESAGLTKESLKKEILEVLLQGESLSLQEVAKILGVNDNRAKSVENRIFRKLRHPSRSKQLTGYL